MDNTNNNVIQANKLGKKEESLNLAPKPVLDRETLINDALLSEKKAKDDYNNLLKKQSLEVKATEGLMKELSGQQDFVQKAEKEVGLPELTTKLSDVVSQMNAEKQLGSARLLQEEKNVIGTGVSTGMLNTRLSNTQRDNAIKQLILGAKASALQGQVESANALIDRAVQAKYEPIKAKLDIQKFNLDRIDNLVKEGKLDLTNAQKNKLNLQIQKVNKDEEDMQRASELTNKILKNQPTQDIINKLNNAHSVEEINAIPGIEKYLMSKEEILSNKLKQAQISKTWYEIRKAREEEITKNSPEVLTQKRDTVRQKLNLVNDILQNTKGLAQSVGTTKLGRIPITKYLGDGSSDKFKANVKTLLSKETLDNLIDIKKQGGTFGALSDGERMMLADAANTLAGYAKKDKNGNFTGEFEGSEKDIDNALKTIQKNVFKSYVRTGGVVTKDLQGLADEVADEYVNDIEGFLQEGNNAYSAY